MRCEPIQTSLPVELAQRLREQAGATGRSVSGLVRDLLSGSPVLASTPRQWRVWARIDQQWRSVEVPGSRAILVEGALLVEDGDGNTVFASPDGCWESCTAL